MLHLARLTPVKIHFESALRNDYSFHLMDIRLDEDKTARKETVKRVIYILKNLTRCFTMTNDRRLAKRFLDFLDDLSYTAFNDFKIADISQLYDDNTTIPDNYWITIDGMKCTTDLSSEEFLLNVALHLMDN
jgi:hypothetical protein